MAEKFYAIFTMAVLLGFVVMLKLITVPVAVGLWVFISVVVLFTNISAPALKKGFDMTSKELQKSCGSPLKEISLFFRYTKRDNIPFFTKYERKYAKLYIYERFCAVDFENSAIKLTRENLILADLPENTTFGVKAGGCSYYFRSLDLDTVKIIETKLA